MLKRIIKSGFFISFSFGFIFYILIILPILIGNNGVLIFFADYSTQSIPFAYHIRDSILSGNVVWDWSTGLGGQFLSNYSFYNLFSPFTVFYLIVPRSMIIYAMPFITALKFGAGTALAYLFIKRFVNNKHYAVIGGIIYMFSSAMSYNMVFHFTDAIALFPLLLIALEELCQNKKRAVFALSVALLALTNYYFFFGQVVFCIIYYFVRYTDKGLIKNIKRLLPVLAEGIAGVALTAVFLLPVALELLNSDKATAVITLSDMLLYHDIYDYLKIIQSAFTVPDPMYFTSFFPELDNSYPFGNLGASVAAYLPFFSAAGVISYIFAKRKSRAGILIMICTAMAFIPVLNQLFSALNNGYYARWYYMPMLIGCMMSVKALEEKISFKPGIIACGGVLGALIVYMLIFDTDNLIMRLSPRSTYSKLQSILFLAIAVISLILLIILVKSKRDKEFIPKLYIFASICTYMCFGIMVHYIFTQIPNLNSLMSASSFNSEVPSEVDTESRISIYLDNANMYWGNGELQSPTHFNSIHDVGFKEFLDSSGLRFETGVYKDINFDERDLCNIVSVRYFLDFGNTEEEYKELTPVSKIGEYTVYENPSYIPMGFIYDNVISKEDFMSVKDANKRKRLYIKYLVAPDPDEFADILSVQHISGDTVITDEEYLRQAEERRSNTAYSVKKDTTGLTAKINLAKENVVFFSVSYNDNWKAYIDGSETKVYNINNGLIGVRTPSGDHEIKLVYTVKGFAEGAVISCIAAVGLIVYIMINKRKAKVI